jgi:predicted DNA-binding WGR domain protein
MAPDPSLKGLLGRYEYRDSASDKFWQISFDPDTGTYLTEWGKNGRPPQDSKAGLNGKEALKKIQEKISKGYRLTTLVEIDPYEALEAESPRKREIREAQERVKEKREETITASTFMQELKKL